LRINFKNLGNTTNTYYVKQLNAKTTRFLKVGHTGYKSNLFAPSELILGKEKKFNMFNVQVTILGFGCMPV